MSKKMRVLRASTIVTAAILIFFFTLTYKLQKEIQRTSNFEYSKASADQGAGDEAPKHEYSQIIQSAFSTEENTKRKKLYDYRKTIISEYCKENGDSKDYPHPGAVRTLYYLKSIQAYVHYCGIGKVAGGTWRRNLAQILFEPNCSTKATFEEFTESQWIEYLNTRKETVFNVLRKQLNVLSFVFVRHPISRLASAYYDKMHRYWNRPLLQDSWPVRKEILMIYKNYTEEEALKDLEPVNEELFARYLVDSVESGGVLDLDGHWRPQTSVCAFCDDDFDVVGRMETFEYDRDFLLKVMKAGKASKKRHSSRVHHNKRKPEAAEKLFLSKIPPDLRAKLFDIYKHDFDMLGYERKELN